MTRPLYANQRPAGRCNDYLFAPSGLHLVFILLSLLLFNGLQAQRFPHPGIPFTQYDLDQLKQNITQEPWLSAYNAFKNDNHSKLSYGMKGPFATVTRAPNLNNVAWIEDMVAVHNLAFMWVFTGDSAYARKATNMMDAWAVTNTTWGGGESMLDIGDYAQYWATGADILRGTFPGWSADNTAHVKNYFNQVLWPTSWVPFPLRDQNKGALQLKIALAAAAFLDDPVKFNQAIEVYRMDAGGGMRNSLPNGEVGDAGRDDHWRVQAAALVWGAEVAFKQGIDMYAELNNRVLAIGELYNKYAFEGDTMTFIPFGGYASYWTNWGIPTGARRGDFSNILKAAYSLRKGMPTPYNDMMRAALGGAGGEFLYLKSSDTSTAVALPPVNYPADLVQPASYVTNYDIGNPGMAGSALYNNGTWTVKGAGNSLSTAMNLSFRKVTGDAGLIVRVAGMSLSTGGCGVMMRESLAPGAPYYDIQLLATGGVGRHYQPKAPWWLKIERVGTRIFTYHSQDGINWTNLSCFYSTAFPNDMYLGFYAISNNTSAYNT
ncbi:MAG TPA: alginate lyase family protein, partial [Niastella sp.]